MLLRGFPPLFSLYYTTRPPKKSSGKEVSVFVWEKLLPSKRWKKKKVQVGEGHFHTFYIEKNFTFFLTCVKYVYEVHRPAPPSFSGFFALFDVGRCRSFANLSKKSKISSMRKVEGVLHQHTVFRFCMENLLPPRHEKNDVGRCQSFPYLSM